MAGIAFGYRPVSGLSQTVTSQKVISANRECQLLLPKVIYATPGLETNIYFRNIVLDPSSDPYLFDVESTVGTHESDRWTWVPSKEDAGDHSIKIEVRDFQDQVVAKGTTFVRVPRVDAGAGREVKLLCIGDSLTAASIYTKELLKLGAGGQNPRIILLGTNGPKDNPENLHEGYGGWKYRTFVEKWQPSSDPADAKKLQSSPFLFLENGKPTLNFSRYLKEKLAGDRPDYITIMLGINDVFGATDLTRQQTVEGMIKSARTLVASIREALPDTPIAIIPPVPPSTSQDSFGASYRTGQTRWMYRKNQHEAVLQLMKEFEGREGEHLFVIPAYANLDCEHNYPLRRVAANSRKSTVVSRPSNGVHPDVPGYLQIGDSIFSWIKSQVLRDQVRNH